MEDEFELPVISKLYDLTSFAVRMRQTVEPKGEFGLDSSILLNGKTVPIGDLYTSLATGFEISPAMNDVIPNIVNSLKENDKNSKIPVTNWDPVSKKFTKIFQSKNGKTYSMDTKINEEGSKTFSTLASADLFRKIIQNDFVCHEVCDFKLLKWGVSSRSSALYCPMPRWPCRLRTKWPSGRLTPWSCNFFM